MPIVPDDRNWTFVLDELCPECQFDTQAFPREELGSLIRANAAQWPTLLTPANASERPNDHTWSALEYGCHVRDVFRLYHYRLDLMLANDGAHFANWDQDETAIANRYHEQNAETVTAELVADADKLADRFDTVKGNQWQRTGFRSDGAAFTIETFGRYCMHDPAHHIHDVQVGYRELG
jgi:hypothetical protein